MAFGAAGNGSGNGNEKMVVVMESEVVTVMVIRNPMPASRVTAESRQEPVEEYTEYGNEKIYGYIYWK